ncbi:hypothetical protein [Pedobacter sp. BAL39]|uniref:hypothetical protein n=1 Tax=Pedobacter sp. BAL39 TaxID=391596 RepID=UPI0012FCBD04|nr:hypothetical protein [Pedobacter sp. BAL39]
MKIFIFRTAIVMAFLAMITSSSYSQDKGSIDEKKFNAHVKNCLKLDYIFKDSIQIYAFNFKIDIVRTDNRKNTVVKVTANDSLAYQMFPKYKGLLTSDCSFMRTGNKKFSIIIPILVFYKNHIDQPLIDMNAALNAAQSLYSPKKYNNQIDSKLPFGYVFNVIHKLHAKNGSPTDLIFLPLRTIEILNIPKKTQAEN